MNFLLDTPLILASSSPRRKELLEQMGIPFMICASDVDECTSLTDPIEIVGELSAKKARDISIKVDANSLILGADTVVSIDGEVLGKPVDKQQAKEMLQKLSGKIHEVYTGITLICKNEGIELTKVEKTSVKFDVLSERDIDDYIATGEPMDKAGAYGIQGKCAAHIVSIEGCFYNVMGLPLNALKRQLMIINGTLHDEKE